MSRSAALVRFWNQLRRAPVILQGYVAFAIAASVVHFSGLVPSLGAVLIPYTGWSGLGLYLFTLPFAVGAIATPQRKQVYGVLVILALIVVFGLIAALRFAYGPDSARQDFNNPYLFYSEYQPIVTIALPAFWLTMLLSPAMRAWIHAPTDDDGLPARRQFSVADLLYLAVPIGLALALSLGLVGLVRQARSGSVRAGTPAGASATSAAQP